MHLLADLSGCLRRVRGHVRLVSNQDWPSCVAIDEHPALLQGIMEQQRPRGGRLDGDEIHRPSRRGLQAHTEGVHTATFGVGEGQQQIDVGVGAQPTARSRADQDRKPHYLAIGVNLDGEREVLGMWFQRTEGAKFWLAVLTDLKQRGVQDVLVCCVDGLTGFPEAIEAVFPQAWVQTCIVHLVRSSLRFVPYRDKRAVAADLKKIYTATDQDAAADQLTAFAERWDARFPTISRSWLEHWEQITPFLAFPPDVRRVVYTTNTIEALNRQIRKIIKTRGHFPTEDAARKLLFLAITRAQTKWRNAYNWNAALAAFKIHFGDRIPDTAI
jgi:hypothetical protein